MNATMQIDTRGFERFVREAAAAAKIPVEKMLRAQAGKVLEKAIQFTPASKKQTVVPRTPGVPLSVDATGVTFSMNDGSRKKGTRGREWLVLQPGNKLKRRVKLLMAGPGMIRTHSASSNNTWQMLRGIFDGEGKLAEFNRRVAQKNTARGLSKRSWLEIADALGIDVPSKGFIRTARPLGGTAGVRNSSGQFLKRGTGDLHRQSTGRQFISGAKTVIELVNMLPTGLLQKDGARILYSAIQVRQRAMEIEIAKGVFEDLKYRASRYPGIFVSA